MCQHSDELERLNVEVLLISFSSMGFARVWSKETCPAFHLLLDRERASYRTYGLESSLARSWSLKMIKSYVRVANGAASRGTRPNWAAISS